MIINLIMTKVFSNYFQMITRQTSILSIGQMIETILKYGKNILVSNLDIGIRGSYLVIIIILSIIFIASVIKSKKYFHIFEYIVLVLLSVILPILPLLVMPVETQYLEARMCMCFGAIWGVILLYLVMVMKVNGIKVINTITCIMILVAFLINSIYFIRASSENMATVYMDRNLAEIILYKIDEYEKTTGKVVDTVAITWDKSSTIYYDGQPILKSTNARGMVTDFSVVQALEYYSGRDFKGVYQVPEEVESYFKQYDWNCYSEEQLLFKDNVLYLCLY